MGRLCTFSYFLFFLCFFVTTRTCLGSGNSTLGGCIEGERQALLKFKESLIDSYHRLSSWEGKDCCKWTGVSCHEITDHVLKLDLRVTNLIEAKSNSSATGSISNRLEAPAVVSDLLALKYLNHLDLSGNDFQGSSIPEFIGSMQHLRYLNLSNAHFGGIVPPELGNLSSLQVLDLHDNIQRMLTVHDLMWVTLLPSLQRIDLSGADLSGTLNNLIEVLNMLPSLLEINLSYCGLGNTHTSPPAYVNYTLSSIQYLNLSSNSFGGKFPSFFRNMTSLRVLDLSRNYFNSTVPQYLGTSYKSLVQLNLAGNRFDSIEGGFSTILWNQCQLKSFDLSSNSFHGEIVQLDGNLSARCIAYDLEILSLSFNKFTGHLPQKFLGQLKNLKFLGLGDNLFSGSIPSSIGGLSSLRELSLSYNQFTGAIPASLGQLSALRTLYLDGNKLSGSIPASIGGLSALVELDLSFNQLNGGIPASIGGLTSLRKLNLGFNQLKGTVPVSLGLLSKLETLEIYFNSLEGVVSEVHFAKTSMLKYMDTRSNSMLMFKMSVDWVPPFQLNTLLAGSCKVGPLFPQWLQTQKGLVSLNLSSASITGDLPSWLRGMRITGLLLSDNQITGPLSNFPWGIQYMDLSHNNITGHLISTFPSSITDLYLSHNLITGGIPSKIGELKSITSLDFSNNRLSGMIPHSITALSSLSHFNLSYNNLSGKIPTANHIQILSDPSVYAGNPQLCGPPLPKKCPGDH